MGPGRPRGVAAAVAGLVLVCWPGLSIAREQDRKPRDFTLVFVGGSSGEASTPTLTQLKTRLASLNPSSAVVVFTGNYTEGPFPREAAPGRSSAERAALAHVTATADFVAAGGKVYFLPGQRDFPDVGTKAVERLRAFLNSAYAEAVGQRHIDVMPEAACGTVKVLELTDQLGLVLLNSQWWMQDRRADPALNDHCEVKSRHAFAWQLGEVFRDYRDRRLVLASHQALGSYGERGGAFTARAHLSPPILGSAWVLARQSGLVPGDQSHPVVQEYVKLVFEQAESFGAYVFASGNDANLQYLVVGNQAQLVAGTSARTATPTVAAARGDFAEASPGWVELAIGPSGEGEARFFSAEAAPLFRTALPAVARLAVAPVEKPPALLPAGPVRAGFFKRDVWNPPGLVKLITGGFYSDAFALELPYEVLDLQTEHGGLTVGDSGGGRQTNTIQARDPRGGEWRIRSTTKDPSRLLPYPYFQIEPLLGALDYGYTAVHPEAALAMPRLSEAVGVLHPRPRLMFVPDQEGLGPYRGFITNEVALVEQRPDETILPGPHPEGETRFWKFDKMVDKLRDQPARHRLDQEAMLRARLLDVFAGDFDRASNQWRFAVREHPDGTQRYTPVPLDRDQAFSHYDGVGLMVARLMIPEARKLQPFTGNYGRLGWQLFNSRDLDAVVLNGLSHPRWMAIAAEVQKALTDAVIDEALATWHPETYALDGARIAAALKARRDTLTQAADEFYRLVSKGVDVVGSTHDDVFDVSFEEHGAVRVTVRDRAMDTPPHFDRVFHAAQTRQLRLYALAGDDLLSVHGKPHGGIDIRFVGDQGSDRVAAADGQGGEILEARAIAVYDSPDGAQIEPSISVSDARSTLAEHNQYWPDENHAPDYGLFVPGLRAGPEGVSLGGTYSHIVQGFKKAPFAARHDVSAFVSTRTAGLAVDYHGLFPESASLLDQDVALSLRTPDHTHNFFGYTNAFTENIDGSEYYQVRQASYEARYGLSFPFNGNRARIGAVALGQVFVTEATPNRFVVASADVTPDTFGPRYFAGGRLFAELNTFDRRTLPRRGIALQASIEGRCDVAQGNQFSMSHKLAGTLAIPFDRAQRLVLITTAAIEGIVGDHPYFFAPTLGEDQLRSYQPRQLAGEIAFAQTSDLRLEVWRIETVIPGSLGVSLSLDHGRVFGPSIVSSAYHVSLGGSVWWSIVDRIGMSVGYHRGLAGGSRFSFQLGARFADSGL